MKILLCGFMGCGKTGIGKYTAKKNGYKFIDMDKYIVNREKMSVVDIFEKKGEPYFRELETTVLKELCQRDKIIIASGGGTILKQANIDVCNQNDCKIIFLDTPLSAIQERLKCDTKRPLLQRPDRQEFIEKLYIERYPIYKKAADYTVNAGAPVVVVAKRLKKYL